MSGKHCVVLTAVLAVLLPLPAPVAAQEHVHVHEHAAPTTQSFLAEGEVRRVDRAGNRLTLRHGPLENLGMGAMTMVFRVADPRLLDGLKVGDRVRFHAERIDGVLTVTRLEPAP